MAAGLSGWSGGGRLEGVEGWVVCWRAWPVEASRCWSRFGLCAVFWGFSADFDENLKFSEKDRYVLAC